MNATARREDGTSDMELAQGWRSRFLDSQLYRSRHRLRTFSSFPRKGNDMGCLGVHFALLETEVEQLKALSEDAERLEFLQNAIEESYFGDQPEWYCESDKAWDAIHRALTDGKLTHTNGQFPFSHVILGGEILYEAVDYIMSLKSPEQVKGVAAFLKSFGEVDFQARYFKLDASEYGYPVTQDDFTYAWRWLQKIRDFYQRAAAASRFVLFTADQ
jgi:hypothetical protein